VGADPQSNLVGEIARLEASIDRIAAATENALAGDRPARADDGSGPLPAEHEELRRQLEALRERVALAADRNEDPPALRAELATLLSFARTLQADADDWRSALDDRTREVERQRAAARREQERSAAELDELARRRDDLQLTILQTAVRMAQQNRGECRRTLPVFTLGEGLTVCSVSVSRPRRWFRFAEYWLVTLNRSHDVLIRRE
jgi:hypothetical protein